MLVTVSLLADRPDAIAAVADMRWREWGHPPGSEDPAWWHEITLAEAGREQLPVTFVAMNDVGETLGAVGLDHYDLDERRETTPWVTGMIVRSDLRNEGVGRLLMQHLEQWAAGHAIIDVWVGTELAAGFYQRCGWTLLEVFERGVDDHVSVLTKRMG
ncbi:MAG TPA: GNAT family N-acetyltransferase [Jatrophihabitantaceae bacterium]